MFKKQTIETQLDCRATANLRSEIALDLSVPDRPITDVLQKDTEDQDESKDNSQDGGRDSGSES